MLRAVLHMVHHRLATPPTAQDNIEATCTWTEIAVMQQLSQSIHHLRQQSETTLVQTQQMTAFLSTI